MFWSGTCLFPCKFIIHIEKRWRQLQLSYYCAKKIKQLSVNNFREFQNLKFFRLVHDFFRGQFLSSLSRRSSLRVLLIRQGNVCYSKYFQVLKSARILIAIASAVSKLE